MRCKVEPIPPRISAAIAELREFSAVIFKTPSSVSAYCETDEIPQKLIKYAAGTEKLETTVRIKEKALTTINAFIAQLIKRVDVQQTHMEHRLPKAAQELDALILYIDTGEIQTRSWGVLKYTVASTPYLTQAYQDFLSRNASEVAPWQPTSSLVGQWGHAVPAELEEIHEALEILDLAYLDPEAARCFGAPYKPQRPTWANMVKEDPRELKVEEKLAVSPGPKPPRPLDPPPEKKK